MEKSRIGNATWLATLAVFSVANAVAAPEDRDAHRRPDLVVGAIQHTYYDGQSDDLLTAGLGADGIQGAAPGFAVATSPTAAELRRRAIYNNYRALVDVSAAGGYGRLYGPHIGPGGTRLPHGGKIAGDEYLALASAGPGRGTITLMVQVPDRFDPKNPCIVTAASSGSRGIYGAIGTAGEWGLKRGCAVAYTDKGSGTGAHDLQSDTVNLMDGRVESAARARWASTFTADLRGRELERFNQATPYRFAFKHAHSRQNPEQDWGRDVLWSVEFAFHVLNEKFGAAAVGAPPITPANTIVIASSVSNGGGAALAAAELDRGGLIDGVAVSEPQIQTSLPPGLVIERGGKPVAAQGRTLYDYFTAANLFQPCAALAVADSPATIAFVPALARNRCQALAAKGLLSGADPDAWPAQALAKLRALGWESESDPLHLTHYAFATPAIAVTYANAYGRANLTDNLCGFSFAATGSEGKPSALAPESSAQIFAHSSGIPPTAGVNLINNLSVGGPILDALSLSPSTGLPDLNLDGALCLRGLWTGGDITPAAIHDRDGLLQALRLQQGVRRVQVSADLHGKPAIVVHGRADALIPANHASRAWYGANRMRDRGGQARYYEVTNAQHFDSFLSVVPGYDSRFVPLHVYFNRALDLMYEHLKNGKPLPPSQIVRTTPRGVGTPVPPLEAANVPAIAASPALQDRIKFVGRTLQVPE